MGRLCRTAASIRRPFRKGFPWVGENSANCKPLKEKHSAEGSQNGEKEKDLQRYFEKGTGMVLNMAGVPYLALLSS
jgi:hypothetical protein